VVIGLAVAAIRAVPLRTYESSDRLARRKMMRFGGWLTVTNIIGPLMVFSDRFLIGAIAGAAAVALYAIPFNLISQLLVLPQSLSNALFPRFAAGQSERLSSEALLATTFVLTPIAMVAMLLVGPFLRLWIGEAAALQSTPIALVLITGFWANGLAQLPFASLQAAGRTDVTAKLHLVELVPYFALLWLGLNTLGVVGAALAWSIRVAVDFVALAILDRIDMKVFRLALIQAVPVVVLALVMVETGASSLMRYSAALLICLITGIYLARVVPEVVLERVRLWLAPLRKVLPQ
jgi:O-antigen/teichoic acid export membrane protein